MKLKNPSEMDLDYIRSLPRYERIKARKLYWDYRQLELNKDKQTYHNNCSKTNRIIKGWMMDEC